MRIAINALPAVIGGGVTFYRELLPELAALDDRNDYVVLLHAGRDDLLQIPPTFEKKFVRAPKNVFLRFCWEQLVLPMLLSKWKIDLIYSQTNVGLFFGRALKVVAVTGANPYSQLGNDPPLRRARHAVHRLLSKASARAADIVLFLSEDSRTKIVPKLGIRPGKSAVVYWGCRADRRPPTGRFSDLQEYILTVSVLWEHKNLERLMSAYDALVSEGAFGGPLVIAGAGYRARYFAQLDAFRTSLTSHEKIIFTGHVEGGDLADLYRRCRLFVFPSLEETLGLPLLEAMRYGAPIAASDCDLAGDARVFFNPFRELAGEAAEYFDPLSVDSMKDTMRALVNDDARRARLADAAIARAAFFDWRSTARKTIAVFESLKHAGDAGEVRTH